MRDTPRVTATAALALLAALAEPAHADFLVATLGQPIHEVSHEVEISVAGGVATYTVKRVFANTGDLDEEVSLDIDLPVDAVATGLRIRAGDTWYSGELMDRDEAAALYEELTGRGAYELKDPALLQWVRPGVLHLQIFPVSPNKTSVVEYTLTAPTVYAGGRYYLSYSQVAPSDELVLPVLKIRAEDKRARIFVNDRLVARDTPVVPAAGSTPADAALALLDDYGDSAYTIISETPPAIDTVAARLGRVSLSGALGALRLEIDAAPELRPAPKALSVVFLVDASYSRGEAGLAADLAAAEAFLSHVPDAKVEVVAFRRRAARLFGEFVSAGDFAAELRAHQRAGGLALGNGSALDEGCRVAAEALAGRAGPRMIVALTDGQLRARFTDDLALKALAAAKGATVHLAISEPDAGEAGLARDDEAPLAEIPAAFGGLLVRLSIPDAPEKAELARAVLELVRPVRIDFLKITGPDGAPIDGLSSYEELREGEGFREVLLSASPPKRVILEGRIWQKPWRYVVEPDKDFARTAAALLISSELLSELSDDELRKAAYLGGAVSPVTSYLAIEPGVRPSTSGIDREMLGGGGLGLLGIGAGGGGAGFGTIGLGRRPPELAALVAARAEGCKARYKAPAGFTLSLGVETSYDEILDVIAPGSATDDLSRCLVEAVWETRLDSSFNRASERFTLYF